VQPGSIWAAFVALSVVCSSCAVETGPSTMVVAGDGTLTVDFTVDESTNPNLCDAEGAASIEVDVFTRGGASIAQVVDSCRAGVTSVGLPPGSFDGTALLLDAGDRPITTAVDLGPIRIYGGDELVVPIDFPADSFL